MTILVSWLLGSVAASANFTDKDPERNFEAFWQLFNRYYAHFDTRGVDWQQQYRRFRPSISPSTSDEALLTIFNQMVAPLRDGHVVISPTGDLPASAKYARFYQEFPTKDLQTQFHQVSLAFLQQRGFGQFVPFQSAPYNIGGYCRSTEYGYLQLNGFGGMPLTAFARQLDDMVAAFSDVKGLILDIRINGGGSPAYLGELIGRLTQVKRLVGYGRARIGKKSYEYGPWTSYYVLPRGERKLIKPIVVLTSGSTISAGDHCALYLREFPYVKLAGEQSNGIFSPMLGKRLPNGWEIALSDGQIVDAKRVSYEAKGVPVDWPLMHHRNAMLAGHDPVLDSSLMYLQANAPLLSMLTICPEQIAVTFYADSLLSQKIYGDVTAYSNGLVEEDATLLTPFAAKCLSLKSANSSQAIQRRFQTEQRADSAFYSQNVQNRFYVNVPAPIKKHLRWPFTKRNARRLTVAHHIKLNDNYYVRLHLNQGGWQGETVLIVLDGSGHVIEHCALPIDYLSSHIYR
ncbi:S41 family peptidase [Fibrella aquatilis]|uniref:S41 family peptidase n=1 Tax=Fibrella aquatilis TaxID=2817059 RepID=A0A939JXP3_9BACT|nr:S41 family peptidase [Fibrella aquatilis]MBO0933172.1 S41 family peptidase [Fibrella aquatilis]